MAPRSIGEAGTGAQALGLGGGLGAPGPVGTADVLTTGAADEATDPEIQRRHAGGELGAELALELALKCPCCRLEVLNNLPHSQSLQPN